MKNNICRFVGFLGFGIVVSSTFAQNVVWLQPTRGVSIAVDAMDNVYTVDYEQALGAEMSLTKRDMNGTFVWNASFDQQDPTKWERASWVATDNEGNVIVCGTYMSGFSNPVEAASIVMKFDSSGNLLWRNVYETSFDGSYTIKCLIDASDNIYVLGTGSGPPGYVTKVKKFSPDGTALWTYYDSAGIGLGVNFKFTPDGFIAITGRSVFGSINGYAKIDVNGNEVWSYPGVFSLSAGDCDGDAFGNTYLVNGDYVTKLGTSGALIWEQVYGIAGRRVELGSDNLAVVSGFPNSGAGAAFIKVDEHGGLVWSNLDADGPLMLLLHAQMHLDGANNAYLAAGTLFEMAICKVNSDGTSAWTQTVPGSYANAMALGDNDNSVFVVGGTTARISQGLNVVAADSLEVTRGTHVSGGVVELSESDNIDLSLHRATGDIQSWTEFEVKAVSPVARPSSLEVTLEGSVFARSQVDQTIDLFDYLAGNWEQVDTRPAARFTDSTVTVAATGDLSRFVEAGTMFTKSRIRYFSPAARQQFSSNTDQFIWTIGQ